jgi:hypothetical protein
VDAGNRPVACGQAFDHRRGAEAGLILLISESKETFGFSMELASLAGSLAPSLTRVLRAARPVGATHHEACAEAARIAHGRNRGLAALARHAWIRTA